MLHFGGYGSRVVDSVQSEVIMWRETCSLLLISAKDIEVIPLSSALCCYARSKAALYSQGTPIEDLDLFIGCTAVANQMIMVTENKKHLERIPNIEIENWVHRG